MDDSKLELEHLHTLLDELEGKWSESLPPHSQSVQNIQGLVYKIEKNENGRYVFTLLKDRHVRGQLLGRQDGSTESRNTANGLLLSYIQQAFEGKIVQFEHEHMEQYYLHTLSPTTSKDKVMEVIGSVTKITQLRRLEQERLRMLKDFTSTLQILPNIVFKCRRAEDGKIYFILKEGALAVEDRLTTETVIGKAVDELFDEPNATIMIKAFGRAFDGETVEFVTQREGRFFHTFVQPVAQGDNAHDETASEIVGFISEFTDQKQTEEKFHEMGRALTTQTGEAFFLSLVEQLNKVLHVDCALLGRMDDTIPDQVNTLAVYANGGFLENFSYDLKRLYGDHPPRPDSQVEGSVIGQKLFESTPIAGIKVERYIGFPLFHTNQTLIGMLLVLNPNPSTSREIIDSIVKIFAMRASAELERKMAEEELVISNALLKATQEAMIDGILVVDQEHRVTGYNRRFTEQWEIEPELMVCREAKLLERVLSELENDHYYRQKFQQIYHDPYAGLHEEMVLKDGRVFDMVTQPVLSEKGTPFARIWYFRDVTEQKKNEEQIKHQAYFDVLTGLPNRMLFQDRLSQAVAKASRNEEKLAVMFLNLDRFKIINETLSHTIGDLLLKQVSMRLKQCLHEGDTLSRLGGDEFKIILPHIEQEEEAAKVAEKIIRAFAKPFLIEEHELYITVSIGISLYPEDGTDNKTLVINANAAMNRAKSHGGNTYQLYKPSINATAFEKLSMESDLRKAMERGELHIHYQPRVNLATNRISGMEALLRWEHPVKGRISPASFIPLAEETDLIVLVDRYVLRTVCKQSKRWQEAGFPPLRVAVNISARHFQQSNLVETVAATLKETGLHGQYLELEITEGTTMHDAEAAIATIYQLKELGVNIAIDDFGTGYSSLSYLKKFPIDTLKIDQSFVQDINIDWDNAAIISYIISLGHSLRLNVVAEGVETKEQLHFLREGRCNEMQGYLFSPPLPPEEFEQLLLRQNYLQGRI